MLELDLWWRLRGNASGNYLHTSGAQVVLASVLLLLPRGPFSCEWNYATATLHPGDTRPPSVVWSWLFIRNADSNRNITEL